VLEAVIVRVNDRIVTLSEFRERLRLELGQRTPPLRGEEVRRFAEQLLDAVLQEQVLLERAREKRIEVSDADVDRAIKGLREANDLTDDRVFQKALEESGMTVDQLRERYRQSLLLQRTVQSEVGSVEITTEEVRQEYERLKEQFRVPEKVELEQLFFPVAEDGSDREAVLARARGLVERVRRGADLKAEATLAGVELTSLGEIPVGDLRPELREVLDGLEPGGITDPIATTGGYQVLRLVRRIPAGYEPFEAVKEQLRRRLSQQRYQEQTRGLVERLEKRYLVEVHPELLDLVLPAHA